MPKICCGVVRESGARGFYKPPLLDGEGVSTNKPNLLTYANLILLRIYLSIYLFSRAGGMTGLVPFDTAKIR